MPGAESIAPGRTEVALGRDATVDAVVHRAEAASAREPASPRACRALAAGDDMTVAKRRGRPGVCDPPFCPAAWPVVRRIGMRRSAFLDQRRTVAPPTRCLIRIAFAGAMPLWRWRVDRLSMPLTRARETAKTQESAVSMPLLASASILQRCDAVTSVREPGRFSIAEVDRVDWRYGWNGLVGHWLEEGLMTLCRPSMPA